MLNINLKRYIKKIPRKEAFKVVYMLYLILGIFLLTSGVYDHQKGYHNSDLGWNLRYISRTTGIEFRDVASDYETYEATDLIIMGNNQVMKALASSILGAFTIGFCIRGLFNL